MESLPLSEAKARLSELVEQATRTHARVSITRHGRPAAVLVAAEDFEAIEETLYWLGHPDADELRAEAGRAAPDSERDDAAWLRKTIVARGAGGW